MREKQGFRYLILVTRSIKSLWDHSSLRIHSGSSQPGGVQLDSILGGQVQNQLLEQTERGLRCLGDTCETSALPLSPEILRNVGLLYLISSHLPRGTIYFRKEIQEISKALDGIRHVSVINMIVTFSWLQEAVARSLPETPGPAGKVLAVVSALQLLTQNSL